MYNKFLDGLQRILYSLIVLLFIVMVALLFSQVILRYFFQKGYTWIEESARYLFIWQVMFSTPLALRYGRHMCIDTIRNMLKGTFKKIITILSDLLIAIFLLVFCYAGIKYSISNYRAVSSGIHISMAYAYSAIPVGGVLMLLYWMEGFIKQSKGMLHIPPDKEV